MKYLVCTMLAIGGVVHLLPLSGVLGGERLAALYGMSFADPNLAILMRHRAVLFGLVGALQLYAVVKPALRSIAFAGAIVSVVSFLYLAGAVGGYNAHVGRVVLVDAAVLAGLIVGAIAHGLMLRTR